MRFIKAFQISPLFNFVLPPLYPHNPAGRNRSPRIHNRPPGVPSAGFWSWSKKFICSSAAKRPGPTGSTGYMPRHKNDRWASPLITKPHAAHNQIISGIFAFSVITVAPGKLYVIKPGFGRCRWPRLSRGLTTIGRRWLGALKLHRSEVSRPGREAC